MFNVSSLLLDDALLKCIIGSAFYTSILLLYFPPLLSHFHSRHLHADEECLLRQDELSSFSVYPGSHDVHSALAVAGLTSVQLSQLENVSELHSATAIAIFPVSII